MMIRNVITLLLLLRLLLLIHLLILERVGRNRLSGPHDERILVQRIYFQNFDVNCWLNELVYKL